MRLDYKLQDRNISSSSKKKSLVKRWQVPRRILCFYNFRDESIKELLENLISQLWNGNSSGLLVYLEEKDSFGINHLSAFGSRGNIREFILERHKELNTAASKGLKSEISEMISVFKPELMIFIVDKSIAVPCVQASIELNIATLYKDIGDLPALDYLLSSAKFKNKIAKFKHRDSSQIEEILLTARQLIELVEERKSLEESKKVLRIAAVMDEFTLNSYSPECELLQITPENVISQLAQFTPDMLFIESAWNGKNNLWDRKIGNPSLELREAIDWCKERYIPTVFWNKEDPVHFETFLTTASLFDHVFTTDIDSISQYKASLGHDRVYLLPFACQPKSHNPIEVYERKDAFVFAGAYYVRYPERIKDLETYVVELPKFKPFEIFDRNFGKNDSKYQFPPEYQPFIVGTLPFNEIDKAYKGYQYAINLNSIKQSQSMFARRLFDLLACNTISLSNFSRGVRLMFGDLVICTDHGSEALKRLQKNSDNPLDFAKIRLAGLRKVLSEHTYAHRLNYIASKALGREANDNLMPPILVVGLAENESDIQTLIQSFELQIYDQKRMLLVLGKSLSRNLCPSSSSDRKLLILTSDEALKKGLMTECSNDEWVAAFSSKDYYGPNYLKDLALATQYVKSKSIGKGAYFELQSKPTCLNQNLAYKFSKTSEYRKSIVLGSHLPNQSFGLFLGKIDTAIYEGESFNVDYFNYCKNGQILEYTDIVEKTVNDLDINIGVSILELQSSAEKITALASDQNESAFFSPELLSKQFGAYSSENVISKIEMGLWEIISNLPTGKHEYIYAQHLIPAGQFSSNEIKFFLEMTPGLNMQFVMRFLNAERKRIGHEIRNTNRNQSILMPHDCAFLELGLRFYESGKAEIKGLMWGHRKLEPAEVLGSNYLILTNQYPSYDDLYRNAFIHTRAKAYKSKGLNFDVFCLKEEQIINFREFENIDVITGGEEALRKLLDSGRYKTICVHFLNSKMWSVLEDYINNIQIRVWLHGSEIHPWHRRMYNYANDLQIEIAKKESNTRMKFWEKVVNPVHQNLKFIFVSETFAKEVMEDLGCNFDSNQFHVIHNPIDQSIFSYKQKNIEQRKKILSIRPFATRQYANDLTVQAIIELSRLENFYEFEFLIIGDGILFDETVEPLRKFKNVTLEKRFVNQSEIAKLHKNYGIFLCPTRWDSHGVSRDEAMASGLIPITTNIAAIPEFVDSSVAMLTDPENYIEICNAIIEIANNPKKFELMSFLAAERISSSRNIEKIIMSEINVFKVKP